MSIIRCSRCEKYEDTDYHVGGVSNGEFLCEDCFVDACGEDGINEMLTGSTEDFESSSASFSESAPQTLIFRSPILLTNDEGGSTWFEPCYDNYSPYLSDMNGALDGEEDLAQYLDGVLSDKVESIKLEFVKVPTGSADVELQATVIVSESLSASEIDELKEYLSGQYSDGWGEGFEQHPIYSYSYDEESEEWDDEEQENYTDTWEEQANIYVHPWYSSPSGVQRKAWGITLLKTASSKESCQAADQGYCRHCDNCKEDEIDRELDRKKFEEGIAVDLIAEDGDSVTGCCNKGKEFVRSAYDAAALEEEHGDVFETVSSKFLQEHPEFSEDVSELRRQFPTTEEFLSMIKTSAEAYFSEVEIEVDDFVGSFDSSDVTETNIVPETFYLSQEGRLALEFSITKTGEATCYKTTKSSPVQGSPSWDEPDISEDCSVPVSVTWTGSLLLPANVADVGDYVVVVEEDYDVVY